MENTPCTPEQPEALIAALAARQHGVLHRRQALALGMTPRMIHWRLRTGRWVPVHEAVYRLAGVPPSWRQDLMAACLVVGAGAVASHRAAAALWALDGVNQPILEVTTPGAGRRRPRRVSVHRTRSLSRSDLTTVDGIPVTRPARSVIDLASVLEPDRLEEALDSALRQGLTSVPHLRRRLHALGAKGRAGTELLGALLDRRDGQRPSESPPELALRRLFLAAGLPEPVPQYELRDGGRLIARFDWAYPDRRIAAEYNSFRHHHGRQAWDRDQARYNRPTALGWLVFTFTDADLRDSARGAIADLCRAYERRVAPSCDSTAAMH